jgi:hypothetical protein
MVRIVDTIRDNHAHGDLFLDHKFPMLMVSCQSFFFEFCNRNFLRFKKVLHACTHSISVQIDNVSFESVQEDLDLHSFDNVQCKDSLRTVGPLNNLWPCKDLTSTTLTDPPGEL